MTRGGGGVSQKVFLHDEGEGGVQTPPKKMTSFMNSPILLTLYRVNISTGFGSIADSDHPKFLGQVVELIQIFWLIWVPFS